MKHKNAWPFTEAVDYVKLDIPDYPKIVRHPMDLGTVSKRLKDKYYGSARECINDIHQTFKNCRLYNPPDSDVILMCGQVEKLFENKLAKLPTHEYVLSRDDEALTRNPSFKASRKRPLSTVSKKASTKGSTAKGSAASVKKKKTSSGFDRYNSKPASVQMQFCVELLEELLSEEHRLFAWIFYEPVDPVLLNIPDYFDKIKQPMDLSLVKKKLLAGRYTTPSQFAEDVRLMFRNCYRYNPRDSDAFDMGKKLQEVFETKYAFLPDEGTDVYSYPQTDTTSSASVSQSQPVRDSVLPSVQRVDQPKKKAPSKKPVSGSTNTGASKKRDSQTQQASQNRKTTKKQKTTPVTSVSTPVVVEQDLTYEEKKQLSHSINLLPPEKIQGILEIITSDISMQNFGGDEIEIDIDSLSTSTLRRLDAFVRVTLELVSAPQPQAEPSPSRDYAKDKGLKSPQMNKASEKSTIGSAGVANGKRGYAKNETSGRRDGQRPYHHGDERKKEVHRDRHRVRVSSSSSSSSNSPSSSSGSDSDLDEV
eukprot:CFRG5886T1